ncbi:hypothetical protein GCM10010440_75160 [Kitasatospora cinereorecta]
MHRHFDAVAPDVPWCGDMTESDTGEGELYPATVLDQSSAECWAARWVPRHGAALVRHVVQLHGQGRVHPPAPVHHRTEARIKIATWSPDFSNTRRRHRAAAGLPPIEFGHTSSQARAETHQRRSAAQKKPGAPLFLAAAHTGHPLDGPVEGAGQIRGLGTQQPQAAVEHGHRDQWSPRMPGRPDRGDIGGLPPGHPHPGGDRDTSTDLR